MGTKATQYSTTTSTTNTNNSDNTSKLSSPAWLINWLSQLTKSSSHHSNHNHSNNKRLSSSSSSSSSVLPWKKEIKSPATTSIVITEASAPIPTNNATTNVTIKADEEENNSTLLSKPRPSITISNYSLNERRNSQYSNSSLQTTSDDQYSYSNRRGSNSSSIISELWSKAKRHHKQPKFHYFHRNNNNNSKEEEYYDSLPSSYRQPLPKHLKRHSISSSYDTTPLPSRPNSIIFNSNHSSQPASPHFSAAFLLNNDVIDSYALNDAIRWQVKHELVKLAIDGLFSIPHLVVTQQQKTILHIGCGGDASWAMEVASKYPKWTVIGLDNYQHYTTHTTSFLSRNFKFIKCLDVLQALRNFPDQTFDFIASRFSVTSYTFDQYQSVMNECIRITKPGGYIEVMEMDLRIYHQRMISSSITHLLNNEVIKVIESKSLDPRLARRLQDLIKSDIPSEIKYISLPIGVWGGKIGVMFRDDVHSLVASFQEEIADHKEVKCRTEDELDYKIDIMDSEFDSNRAFMNLHVMVVYP